MKGLMRGEPHPRPSRFNQWAKPESHHVEELPRESPAELRRTLLVLDSLAGKLKAEAKTLNSTTERVEAPQPVTTSDRSSNPLRPETFDEVIGQDAAVSMMRRIVSACIRRNQPLDHTLLVGSAGTGKSTFSHVIAHELDVDVFEVEAPVSRDTLLELREAMQDRDILRIEEIHQQAIMERRGKSSGTQPEVLYAIMEDRVMPSGSGLLPFPAITIIGTTTDEGMLPDPFLARFPIRPLLEPYTTKDLALVAVWNAFKLGVELEPEAAAIFAKASRGVPRQINNYVKNATMLVENKTVTAEVAHEVLHGLNGVTEDGLTVDMQRMLTFLLTKGKHQTPKGPVYRASVNTIATGIGKSRDSKAISMRVEPYLIECGYVQIGQGRILTDAGITRAKGLIAEAS
jgi:Holliday junction DNA helicase RuvB